MDYSARTVEKLTPDDWDSWASWQESDVTLRSPYFHPEFTRVVAQVRGDVEIGVIREAGRTVGFLPFQRVRRRAKPVGGRLSDYQGVIGAAHRSIDPAAMIRQLGLVAWDFDHLLAAQTCFRPFHRIADQSPYLDLSAGFDAYREGLGKTGADELRQTMRKARKLSREIGPTRLEFTSADASVLDVLIDWKSRQYRDTDVTDVFSHRWCVELLHRLLTRRQDRFRGALSVLWAGDRPAAIHMGMRCRGVLHWWFPAYDPQMASYSPGRILLLELARRAPAEGIVEIDLGRGVAPYKKRVMSAATLVSQGSVDLNPVSRALREGWRRTRDWVRGSPLATPARAPARAIHRVREWMEFR